MPRFVDSLHSTAGLKKRCPASHHDHHDQSTSWASCELCGGSGLVDWQPTTANATNMARPTSVTGTGKYPGAIGERRPADQLNAAASSAGLAPFLGLITASGVVGGAGRAAAVSRAQNDDSIMFMDGGKARCECCSLTLHAKQVQSHLKGKKHKKNLKARTRGDKKKKRSLTLDLHNNEIGDGGAAAVAAALEKMLAAGQKRRRGPEDDFAPKRHARKAPAASQSASSSALPAQRRRLGPGSTPGQLPAHMIKAQLLRKLESDRVVFVQGYTGSGKSSQIPQMLLDNPPAGDIGGRAHGKILCTQPRRLAVAAVANRVAKERGSRIGTEVGYRIGQKAAITSRTQLVFATAGIVLEMLRANGADALLEYSVLILDEVKSATLVLPPFWLPSTLLLAVPRALGRTGQT